MDMKAEQTILTRLLPKTDQTTSRRTGDDGDLQVGWWKGKTVASNKTRFISKAIGGEDVTIDNATGLIWADVMGATGNWALAINSALGLDYVGFTDWRCPNIKELLSIIDFERTGAALDQTFFTDWPDTGHIWSSTVFTGIEDEVFYIDLDTGLSLFGINTQIKLMAYVRGGL